MSNKKRSRPRQQPIGDESLAKGSTLAMVISGVLVSGMAMAQEQEQEQDNESETASMSLETMNIEDELSADRNPYAEPGAPYLANRSADPRRTESMLKTPATISVVTNETITESGRSDLRDILDGQPGITLGTGENGNAFGDRYVIRGHEARSDTFVDGLRDPGMTIRESFAVEQVEVTKGPSSTFAGRGATGGAVNSVTKRASTDFNFTKLSGGIGTDNHHRVTLDTNIGLTDFSAVRVNLLHAAEDVPDRAPASRERKGAAVSLATEPTENLEVAFDIYHFQGDDKPDLGTYMPQLEDGSIGDPIDDIPVYLQDEDFLESTVNTGTLRVGYEISPKVRLVNLTRYGESENGYLATGARGTTGYATEEDATNDVNGFDTISLSTHQGWQDVDYFGNQLNLIFDFATGNLEHDLILGLTYSNQSVLNGLYETEVQGASNCFAAGRGGVGASYCLTDANGNVVDNANRLLDRSVQRGDYDSDWNIDTISLAVMDTVYLTEKFKVFGGVRYDYYDYSNTAYYDPDGFAGPAERELTEFANTDGLWNGHLGAGYSVAENGEVYASVSTATNINGGESDVGTSCGYGGVCVEEVDGDLGKPERSLSLELGTKWSLMNEKLLASAAVFQITKSDVIESATGDSYANLGTLNTGENRVRGVEVGLAGNITPKLSAHAGVAIMDAEVTKSNNEENVGKTLANFAEQSASFQLRYAATRKFAFGGVITYEGERFTGQPDSAANEEMGVPAYTVLDAFASYDFGGGMKLRLNVGNVTDEDYYLAAYRSGSFTYIGDARNTRLTLEYEF